MHIEEAIGKKRSAPAADYQNIAPTACKKESFSNKCLAIRHI
jgi:hypothetical protein